MIQYPKFIVLDNSSLVAIWNAYTSTDAIKKPASDFIDFLTERGFHISLSMSLVAEFLGLEDIESYKSRLQFLQKLPLVAWIRPYDGQWFIGELFDIWYAEVETYLNSLSTNVDTIVETVRQNAWQTGTGADMFAQPSNEIWDAVRVAAQLLRTKSAAAISICRSEPTNIYDVKLKDLKNLAIREQRLQDRLLHSLIEKRALLIKQHGARECGDSARAISHEFYNSLHLRLKEIDPENIFRSTCDRFSIPETAINWNGRAEDFFDLVVESERLNAIGKRLRPPRKLTLYDVSPDSIPSMMLNRLLSHKQLKATRVSRSDLADARIAPIALYADFVQVDKRTHNYFSELSLKHPIASKVLPRLLKVKNYLDIRERLESFDSITAS